MSPERVLKKTQNRKIWTSKEDKLLERAIQDYGTNWKEVAKHLYNRNPSQCAQRWKRIKPVSVSLVTNSNGADIPGLLKKTDNYSNLSKFIKETGDKLPVSCIGEQANKFENDSSINLTQISALIPGPKKKISLSWKPTKNMDHAGLTFQNYFQGDLYYIINLGKHDQK